MAQKYVAYVGSYTYYGSSKGISIMDVDVEKGIFTKRKEVSVNNSSYLVASRNNKYLYSVVDEGVAAFKILPDGDLEYLNTASIRGMRTCYLTVDKAGKFLVTAGYHDGKMTILNINEDGSVGSIASEIFDHGTGTIGERNFRPHVTCVQFTPDEKFLCMVDTGLDNIKAYRFDHSNGHLTLADIIHCELNSAPLRMLFSKDDRHMYMISELKNYVTVYNYLPHPNEPEFQFKQLVSTLPKKYDEQSAACAMQFTSDDKYLFCSNAGDNSFALYERDPENGLLYMKCVLPISGDFPKHISIFPDNKHVASINKNSNSITFFTVDYEKGLLVMNGRPLKVDTPNCCKIVPIEG